MLSIGAAGRFLPATPFPSTRTNSRHEGFSLVSGSGSRRICAARTDEAGSSSPAHEKSTHPRSALFSGFARALAISASANLLLPDSIWVAGKAILGSFGGGVGGDGGGDNGGTGGRGDGFWSGFSCQAALAHAEEWDPHGLPADMVVQVKRLSGLKKYRVSEIIFSDRDSDESAVGADESFLEMLSLHAGGVYTKAQILKELETLESCGMFEEVDMEAGTRGDGTVGLTISFRESMWQAAESFLCINVGLLAQPKPPEMDKDMTEREKMDYFEQQEMEYGSRVSRARPCLLPPSVHDDVMEMLRQQGSVTARLLQRIRDRVQRWYHDEGYACAQVVNFGNLNTEQIVCEVVEGDITQVAIQFQDKLGNACEGNTQLSVVRRELPRKLRRGKVFNIEAGKQALRNINSLSLFSNIEVNPRADEENEGGIVVEIKLKELEQKTAEVSTEWSIVPGPGDWPALASVQPGGSVSFEHRNLRGLNRSLLGSVTTSNFISPQDDLAFKLEYVHPYVDGVRSPRDRTFRASCFNSRKLSPVFAGGPGADDVPPVWVDRAGLKANVTENYTRQSRFTYGVVVEEITTRDESSRVSAAAPRLLAGGGIAADGPPTTLGGTGVDRMAFLQANITRDNTRFVNGTTVGGRDVFQVDQGLGVGTRFPVFNRHQVSLTRFVRLLAVEEGVGKMPPPVLVLHGHYAGCVGDLPGYDAFALGGPYSVRGYSMGELGAARNIAEVAVELRVPVGNTHVYAFVEHGNDLGTSKDVKGNPTRVYRRMGHGSSYGVGVKLGLVRAEYAVDHNSGTGAVFFRFGERF